MAAQVCVSGFRLGTAFGQYPDPGYYLQWWRDEQCEGGGVGGSGVMERRRNWLESTWWSSRPRGFGQEVWAIVTVLLSFMKLGASPVDCCCNRRRRSEWARMPIGVVRDNT